MELNKLEISPSISSVKICTLAQLLEIENDY
jgi:hypothetical protein